MGFSNTQILGRGARVSSSAAIEVEGCEYMNFYRRFPGDYARDTKTLTLLEHGAYTLLLDTQYSSEKPLPKDETLLFRICSAYTKREKDAVRLVLRQFFVEKPTGFVNKRFEKELAHAESRIYAARVNGRSGGRPRRQEPSGLAGANPELSSPDSRIQTRSEVPFFDHQNGSNVAVTRQHNSSDSAFQTRDNLDAWLAIGADIPFGHAKFRDQWALWYRRGLSHNYSLSQNMERYITYCQDENIGVPSDFFQCKRAIEASEAEEKSSLIETNEEKALRLERAAGLK